MSSTKDCIDRKSYTNGPRIDGVLDNIEMSQSESLDSEYENENNHALYKGKKDSSNTDINKFINEENSKH